MYLETSITTKNLVGRLDSGKELIQSISDACKAHAIGSGSFQLFGSLSAVELVAFRKGADPLPIFKGKGCFTILSFDGSLAMYGSEIVLEATCTILAEGVFGPQVIGGIVKTATIDSVDFVIRGFDDLVVERQPNFDAGRFTIDKFRKKSVSIPAPSKDTPVPQKSETKVISDQEQSEISWDDAVTVAQSTSTKKRLVPRHERVAKAVEDLENVEAVSEAYEELGPDLAAGDLLLHPKLGECRVMKVEGDNFARVRLPKGQLRKLSLAICSTEFVEKREGRNVFKVLIH